MANLQQSEKSLQISNTKKSSFYSRYNFDLDFIFNQTIIILKLKNHLFRIYKIFFLVNLPFQFKFYI